MFAVKGRTIAEVWEKSIRLLLANGEWIPTDRGMRALEAHNVMLQVSRPMLEPRCSPRYLFSDEFIASYTASIARGFKNDASIHSRIFEFGSQNVDQMAAAVGLLTRSRHSRRAVVTIWDPLRDPGSNHPPCAVALQLLLRGGKLHLTSVLRSNDAWLAALPDMIALTELQQGVARELGCEVGKYAQLSVSYHLYELDFARARRALPPRS